MIAESKSGGIWKQIVAMVAVQVAFAGLNILVQIVLNNGMSPLVLVTYRQLIGSIFIAPIAYIRERKRRPKLTISIIFHLILSGIMGASLTQVLFFIGLQYTSATFACAFINIVPVITFLIALPFGLESINMKNKVGMAKMFGTLVCVAGAMILTLYRGPALTLWHMNTNSRSYENQLARATLPKRHEKWTLGSITLLGGCICWSSWFIIQAKLSKRYPVIYTSNVFMSLFGAIISALLTFLIHREPSYWTLKGHMQLIAVFYAGMVGSGICFIAMAWCVERRGPVFTAAFSPLVQLIVGIVDLFVLKRKLHIGR
ncbi:hypothetical protein AMTR_s00018p00129800 [Amborella trichopoda]|uniref:WAT1-related protein n=1 Tax=Amborella trichopoda TaxID=13333 RepID=W1PKA8_AMBTC|nr:hypothetical protein AMTR_s00018p00129800 [Amborella trichopoda]